MSVELTYLTLTAILAALMWIPYIVGVNMHPSENVDADFRRPRDLNTLPPWVHRSHRAHLNLIEQLVPMAVLVLIAAQADVSNTVTAWCVAIFFWLRVVHAAGMVSGVARFPIRPIIFSAGWICILVFAWQLLTA